jgi:prophage tail gpP-like protein
VFDVPSTFDMTIGKVDADTLDYLRRGAPVEIYIDVGEVEQLRLTGRIEGRDHEYDKSSHSLTITGMDRARDLQVSSAPLGTEVAGRQFIDVVKDLIDPWGYKCILSNELDRALACYKPNFKALLKGSTSAEYYKYIEAQQRSGAGNTSFKAACKAKGIPIPPYVHDGIVKKAADAKVKPDETIWRFITRIANKGEAIAWMSPSGHLVISRPQYEQDPQYILSRRPNVPKENNVKRASERQKLGEVPTALAVYGKIRKKGKKREPYTAQEFSEFVSYARDNYGLVRPVFLRAKDARDGDEIKKQARYALKGREMAARTYTYTVAGHSQGGRVWTPDTTVQVVDEVFGVNEVMYIASVTMRRGRALNSPAPQETDLELTPLDVWVPEGES